MLSAFVYWQVRFGWHWPGPLALVAVLGVFAPVLGALLRSGLLHVLIMRGLRETTEIARITVTIALTVGSLALATWIWDPTVPRRFDCFFGGTHQVSRADAGVDQGTGNQPAVLLLDELSTGLAPRVVRELYEIVGRLAADGTSILIVEQFARTVLPIADQVAVMLHGRIVEVGSPSAVEEKLSAAYLGA
jgi:ABC-type cobalamin transport system ATPase subunit